MGFILQSSGPPTHLKDPSYLTCENSNSFATESLECSHYNPPFSKSG